jgi:purine catabolism regulator
MYDAARHPRDTMHVSMSSVESASTNAALTPATTISVAEALALPALQRGMPEVLAGAAALGRPIRWVHAGEVPNIASLLVGGELLLTTGMGFDGGMAQRRRFISELVEREIAALVIELGTSLEAIPVDMRDAAATAGLPLVALHREVAFVRVTEAIHTELINRQYGLLRSGEAIKERLIAVMLAGDGLPELLRMLGQIVGNPVFLESADGRVLFHAGASDDLDAWEDARAHGAAVGLHHGVPMGPDSKPGRLLVLPTRRPLTALDEVALRHAGGIVALALLRAREEDELVIRERGDLLGELADGVVTGARAADRARRMGFEPQARSMLAFAVDETPISPGAARGALLTDLRRELDGRAVPVLAGARRDGPLLGLAVLTERPGDDTRAATVELIADAVTRVWSRRRPGTRTVLAVDGPFGWDTAGSALAVAAQSAIAAGPLPDRAWHDGRTLELERLLWSMRAGDGLAAFVTRNLGPLLEHDRERKLALLGTLRALCEHGGHKAEAARTLHLHRQALYHRLSRIEALLGTDLSDPERLTTLHVALRALPYVAP